MALYMIGDIQGCDAALQRLLDQIDFSPSRDTLFALGDLVNRGPDSAGVLRRLMGYGSSARCLLGNHDLHLLALSFGARKPSRKDTLSELLNAPDRFAMLEWLRHQNIALHERWGGRDVLMVHAGVLPQWDLSLALSLARELESVLRSDQASDFFMHMYGDAPCVWHAELQGMARLRVIVNAFTRMRFCSPEGVMEFETKDSARAAPEGYQPWFDIPGRKTASDIVAFGHWSTLGWLDRSDVWALDTGCVWGGCLSALQVTLPAATECPDGPTALASKLFQVQCEQAQKPG